MKNIIEETKRRIMKEEKLSTMSVLLKRQTKLPVNVWVNDISRNRTLESNICQIEVQNDYEDRPNGNTITVSINETIPEILEGECRLTEEDLQSRILYENNNKHTHKYERE